MSIIKKKWIDVILAKYSYTTCMVFKFINVNIITI
jgi:hypothetical protein